MTKTLASALAYALAFAALTFIQPTLADPAQSKTVEAGREVAIEYTLTLADGTVADSNVGGEPLVYTQGDGQILPALEAALEGLGVGDTREVSLAAADGFGEVNPEAYRNVPLQQIPEASREVGAKLVASTPDGRKQQIRVHSVAADHVVLDFNHPLAGEDLVYAIEVVSID